MRSLLIVVVIIVQHKWIPRRASNDSGVLAIVIEAFQIPGGTHVRKQTVTRMSRPCPELPFYFSAIKVKDSLGSCFYETLWDNAELSTISRTRTIDTLVWVTCTKAEKQITCLENVMHINKVFYSLPLFLLIFIRSFASTYLNYSRLSAMNTKKALKMKICIT